MRELVYYVATSIDGFIADPAGDFSHFPALPETLERLFARYPETCPGHVRESLGVTEGPRRFDTVLMGRRTFAPALEAGLSEGAYPHLRQVVVTHQAIPGLSGVEVMTGDVAAHVADLKSEPGHDIWLCGGADLAGQLVDLIDEIQLKVNPVLLGDGVPLLRGDVRPRAAHLMDFETLPGGVTLMTYRTGAQLP